MIIKVSSVNTGSSDGVLIKRMPSPPNTIEFKYNYTEHADDARDERNFLVLCNVGGGPAEPDWSCTTAGPRTATGTPPGVHPTQSRGTKQGHRQVGAPNPATLPNREGGGQEYPAPLTPGAGITRQQERASFCARPFIFDAENREPTHPGVQVQPWEPER